jgi:hypothetical protein
MQIQFNTDKNVTGNEELIASSTSLISEELSRFSRQITRVEVHLSDEDGNKDGFNDKRCMMEARLSGMKYTRTSYFGRFKQIENFFEKNNRTFKR